MRILLIGATGTIGGAVRAALAGRGHEVVPVSGSSGGLEVDLAEPASIRRLYDAAGVVDAVVCAAGRAEFGPVADLTDEAFEMSIRSKMMGQVNLVRFGLDHVAEGGSFTLTSGDVSRKPTAGSAAVSMVGAGVEAFAQAAAIDLEGRYRVNVVSPAWVAESRIAMGLEPMPGIWAADLAAYYVRSVEEGFSGRILDADAPLPK
jgi:NAD(P)-dependent dehydrogenase (short-subunit alcohol dehydrogenase family)